MNAVLNAINMDLQELLVTSTESSEAAPRALS